MRVFRMPKKEQKRWVSAYAESKETAGRSRRRDVGILEVFLLIYKISGSVTRGQYLRYGTLSRRK